ncbi:MAG: bifunctional (p)ppGpp synthetase/guanosine-3',5'-bis(diphosphate) 3'-pyrophosphohydrolase [Alkalispirochaeta sp.]
MIQTLADLQHKVSSYSAPDQERVLSAARQSEALHQGQYRDSGEPYFIHPLQVAEILIDMKLDSATIVSALLHDVLEDTIMTRAELKRQFGREVDNLVNGVTKIAVVKAQNKSVQESETIRKMLLAMVKDVRVILIKLADKLHNMRTLRFKEGVRRREIAQETLDIYAPLAGRLGISWMKDELEDLSLKHLHPDIYQSIKEQVSEKRQQRASYLNRIKSAIDKAAQREGVPVVVESRAKHFYSIYQKMKRYGKELGEIYDLLGIRILCDTTNQCYQILGLVHRLWPPIEGRFKDYVAMPKANQYQSLHTSVLGFDGKMIEIQIRTHEMHRTAEFGVAAHWLYKKGLTREQVNPGDLEIMHRVRDLKDARITSGEFLEEIKREILRDSIYVFTPKGDAIQLPKGATAIDFAYHIHTEVGHHTTGAKADGAIIPLKEPLKNTQVIEVLTSNNAHPHLNWLRYAHTSRARSKIRAWLNKHDENLIINQSIIARKHDQAAQSSAKHQEQQKTQAKPGPSQETNDILDKHKVEIRVGKERNLMIHFAQCCNPRTGDDIIGYVSRGRGIIIHQRECKSLRSIPDVDERLIEVEWETVSPKTTHRFRVVARPTNDLFSEIEGAVHKIHGHLIEGRIDESGTNSIDASFTLEVERRQDLRKIAKSIRAIPAVMSLHNLPQG